MRSRYNHLPSYKYTDVEGVKPVIEKSAGKPLRDYKIYGNSVQRTYGGKNSVFKYYSSSANSGYGIRQVYGETLSEVTLNGTSTKEHASSGFKTDILQPGTYTVSIYGLNVHSKSVDRIALQTIEPVETLLNYIQPDSPKTFNLTKPSALRVMFVFGNGSTYENRIIKCQIENGSVATEYEQYIPAPSIENPQQINSVGEYDEITGKYKIPITIGDSNQKSQTYNILLDEPLRKSGEYCDYIDFKKQTVVKNVEIIDNTGNLSIEESYAPLSTPDIKSIELPLVYSTKHSNLVEINTNIQPSNVKIQYYKKG